MRAGDQFTPQTYRVTRADLVRYAGASGDFNPIHWSDRVAQRVGLPGVMAHGMYTMALGARAVTTWIAELGGDAENFVEYGVRFARPVLVPDDDAGAEVVVAGSVRSIDDGVAQIDLTVISGGEKVLAQARARVRLDTRPAPFEATSAQ